MSQTQNAAIAVVGIDIGKNSFHIVGHDERPSSRYGSSNSGDPTMAKPGSIQSRVPGMAAPGEIVSSVARFSCGVTPAASRQSSAANGARNSAEARASFDKSGIYQAQSRPALPPIVRLALADKGIASSTMNSTILDGGMSPKYSHHSVIARRTITLSLSGSGRPSMRW